MGEIKQFVGKSWWIGRTIRDERLLAEAPAHSIIQAMFTHLRRERGVPRLEIARYFEQIALSVRLDEQEKEEVLQRFDELRSQAEAWEEPPEET